MPLYQPVRIERGTFTPAYAGSGTAGSWTYSTVIGRYSIINNRLFFYLTLWGNTRPTAPTGDARIINLPYTSINVAEAYQAVTIDVYQAITLLSYTVQLGARVPPNTNYIELTESNATTGGSLLPAANLLAGAIIRISGQYEI